MKDDKKESKQVLIELPIPVYQKVIGTINNINHVYDGLLSESELEKVTDDEFRRKAINDLILESIDEFYEMDYDVDYIERNKKDIAVEDER